MKKQWVLTQEAFDRLLDWLDADRDRAGNKYETIRLRLIKIFTCRGCAEAEELADETINRVTARLVEIAPNYKGDPARYFYGVSHKVHLEYLRRPQEQTLDQEGSVANASSVRTLSITENIESEYQCLESCLERLPMENRDLVVRYYRYERHAKIDDHKLLATELDIGINALRIRAHRIRAVLQRCVRDCLEQQPAH